MSDDRSVRAADGTERAEPLGTAEELGVAVYEGIDSSEVTIYDDGTHSGPPKFKETGKTETDSTWMGHPVLAMFCPCGHYIREVFVTSRPELDSVRCEGPTMTVEHLRAELSEEAPESHQQTLTESVATDGGCSVGTDIDRSQDGDRDE